MNRKGFIFTVIALFVIIVAMAMVSMRDARQDIKESGLTSHIYGANAFLLQLEKDLPRVIEITGYRGLLGLEEHISNTGLYLDNLSAAFTEVMTNGSINGTPYEVMDDATLDLFEERMSMIAGEQGMTFIMNITNVSLSHTTPFIVNINVTVDVFAITRDSNTRWNYEFVSGANFSILDLKDPIYSVGTLGRVPSVIKKNNITEVFITDNNDTSKLSEFWNSTMYLEDDTAPSFLMRFTGNLSSSEHGITSLVDTKLLDAQDLSIHTDRSVVDYIYFGSNPSSTNKIVNMSDYFLLDDDHLALFDATDKTR